MQRARVGNLFKTMMPSKHSSCRNGSIPREIVLSEIKCSNDDAESVLSYVTTTNVNHVNQTSKYQQNYEWFMKPVERLPNGRPLLCPPRLAIRSDYAKRSAQLISSATSPSLSETGSVASCFVGDEDKQDGVRKKRCLSQGSDDSSCVQGLYCSTMFKKDHQPEATKCSDRRNLSPAMLSKPMLKNISVAACLTKASCLSNSEFIRIASANEPDPSTRSHILPSTNITTMTPLDLKPAAAVVECEGDQQQLRVQSSPSIVAAKSPQSFKNISLLSLIATNLLETQ